MRVCSKCNTKIGILSILKSTFKREGIIECDNCHAKFKISSCLLVVMSIIVLSCIVFNYFNIHYPTAIISHIIIRGAILCIADTFIYTGVAFLIQWREY